MLQGGQPAPGHVTAYVRVPYRVVGLVVGPKGATIKRIQQDTHTYIITPSRDREPIFEVRPAEAFLLYWTFGALLMAVGRRLESSWTQADG